MRPEDLNDRSPGRLVRIDSSAWAFVPARLPPAVSWDDRLVRALSEADRALGELAGLGRHLPNPYVFTRPFLNREAVLSSRIEGTQASLTDLYALEAQTPLLEQPGRRQDTLEVRNYVRALDHGLRRLNELPISLRLMREMHAILMDGARGERMAPGDFRRVQNWIGAAGDKASDAAYVPPPPGPELERALDALERFIHADDDLPPLIKIALVHYQFEAIHPFLDGNGRIGRLLITLMLMAWGLLPQPLLYLSAYFERHRSAYYRHLLAVSREGAWRQWLVFVLDGIAVESRDAALRARQLVEQRETLRARYQRAGVSANLLSALDELFARPVVNTRQLAAALGMSFRGAQNVIDRLVQDGILEEVTGRRRDRLYVARQILATLEGSLNDEPRPEVPPEYRAAPTTTRH